MTSRFGRMRINRKLEIGVFTAVCVGTINPTVLKDDAEVDDLAQIAHNRIKVDMRRSTMGAVSLL